MRLDHWEKRLQAYLDGIGGFVWGKTDCCMFAVGAVREITGVDHGKSYKHKTELGAAKTIKKHGGVAAIATKHLGEPKSPMFAQRGDVVEIDTQFGAALGICVGARIAAMSADGLVYLPLPKAKQAWSI